MVLLALALGVVIGVWALLTDWSQVRDRPDSLDSQAGISAEDVLVDEVDVSLAGATDVRMSEIADSETSSTETAVTETGENESVSAITESIVIQLSQLTPEQQDLARTFGIEDELVVTPAAAACMTTRLGGERFTAIIGGASPAAMEGLAMFACWQGNQ